MSHTVHTNSYMYKKKYILNRAKRALVSQPSMPVVAKDANISHFLNLSIYCSANDYPSHCMIHTQYAINILLGNIMG